MVTCFARVLLLLAAAAIVWQLSSLARLVAGFTLSAVTPCVPASVQLLHHGVTVGVTVQWGEARFKSCGSLDVTLALHTRQCPPGVIAVLW